MGLGSLQGAGFLELGFRMLTEGEPKGRTPLISSPPPLPPDSTDHDGISNTETSTTSKSMDHDQPDMPAFPDRGGPPPLTTASALSEQRPMGGGDLDMSSEGSNLSGSDCKTFTGHSTRKQREFIPENCKDEQYWEKRRKNNEAARRSREKRRLHDMVLENRIMSLEQENDKLKSELNCLKKRFGLPTDRPFVEEDAVAQEKIPLCESPPSPAASHPVSMVKGGGGSTLTTVMTPYSSPPPLLAVPGQLPLTLQHMSMQGVFPHQRLPYFMTSGSHESAPVRSGKPEPPSAKGQHSQSSNHLKVKVEPEDDAHVFASRIGAKMEPSYVEDSFQERTREAQSSLYSQYPPVSSPGVGNLSASAIGAAAAAHFGTIPGPTYSHGSYDNYGVHSWQRSPISNHSSDEGMSDEPLQLTVHKRSSEDDSHDGDSGRDGDHGSGDTSSSGRRYSNGAGSPPQSSLPFKLRHKVSSDVSAHGGYADAMCLSSGAYASHPYVNGLSQLSEIALAQAAPLSLVKRLSRSRSSSRDGSRGREEHNSTPTDMKHLDPRYLERRRRNNEAARKCRENRKNLTRLREAKSDYLESENNNLRTELDSLHEEMKQLRELLDKKKFEQGLTKTSPQKRPFMELRQDRDKDAARRRQKDTAGEQSDTTE